MLIVSVSVGAPIEFSGCPDAAPCRAAVSQALRIGDYEQALTNLVGTLQKCPSWFDGLILLAGARLLRDQADEAAVTLGRARNLLAREGCDNEAETLSSILADRMKMEERLSKYLGTLQHQYGSTNSWNEVEPLARLTIAFSPDWAYGHLMLGISLFFQGRYQEAELELRTTTSLAPDVAEGHSSLANVLRYLGRFAEAEKEARKAINLNESWGDGWTCLCLTLADIQRYEEMPSVCTQAIKLNPKVQPVFVALANSLVKLQRLEEAQYYATRAFEMAPQSCDALNTLALVLLVKGDLDEAESRVRQASRQCPENVRSMFGLANVLAAKGQFENAEDRYQMAIERHSTNPEPYVEYGYFLYRRNRLKEAEHNFREAMRVKPDSPLAHYCLADLLGAQKNLNEAEKEFRETLHLCSNFGKAKELLSVLLVVKAEQLKDGNPPEAQKLLREATELDPNSPSAFNNLGSLVMKDEQSWQEAESLLRRALELQPLPAFEPITWVNLAELLAKQPARKTEAVTAYKRAVDGFSATGNSNEAKRVTRALKYLEGNEGTH